MKKKGQLIIYSFIYFCLCFVYKAIQIFTMFQVPAHLGNSSWCFLPTPFHTFPASSLALSARNTRTMRFEQKLVKPTNLFGLGGARWTDNVISSLTYVSGEKVGLD